MLTNNQNQLVSLAFSPDGCASIILDQTELPNAEVYRELRSLDDYLEAIAHLRVQGAQLLGLTAAFALSALSNSFSRESRQEFENDFNRVAGVLRSARPTAPVIARAVARMRSVLDRNPRLLPASLPSLLRAQAETLYAEDADVCASIARHGFELMSWGCGIVTHGNAGPLSTGRYGTALGPLMIAAERRMPFRVFVNETRPLMQGARLTSYELMRAGADVTLMCDSAAPSLMQMGAVNAVFLGADCVAANGDVAERVGAAGLAIAANYHQVPVYVFAPSSCIAQGCKSGDDIIIEYRSAVEIVEMFFDRPMAPRGVACFNPAFDVVDNELITGIVTEYGLVKPPFQENLAALLKKARQE